jgi:prevent-host-death family protein
MAITVNLSQAKAQLSSLVERAAIGEEIVIAKAGKPRAKLVAVRSSGRGLRKPGGMKGKIWIADDFDEPLPDEFWDVYQAKSEL